jgi:hypothetical protein
VVDQKTPGNPDRNIGKGKHAGFSPKAASKRNLYVGPAVRKYDQYLPRIRPSGFSPRRACAIHRQDAANEATWPPGPDEGSAGDARPRHRGSIG